MPEKEEWIVGMKLKPHEEMASLQVRFAHLQTHIKSYANIQITDVLASIHCLLVVIEGNETEVSSTVRDAQDTFECLFLKGDIPLRLIE